MRFWSLLPWSILAGLVTAVVLAFAGGGDDALPSGGWEARVVRVVDGDTVRVRLGGREEAVRLIGVDTPESVKPGSPVECFGKAAAAFTRRELGGRRLRLVPDVEPRDRYGRLLAYAYRKDTGRMHNAALVREGYAQPLTIPPNVRHALTFRRLAREAREAGRGLWAACER